MSQPTTNPLVNRGFTLVELLVVISIIAVLLARIFHAYRDYKLKTAA